jgi:hypothetical protein
MKIEDVVNNLIENSKDIYKLYLEILNKNGSKEIFSCLEFLIEKENNYISLLEGENYNSLNKELDKIRTYFGIGNKGIIEEYIESESYLLPYLRISNILYNLICNKEDLQVAENAYDSDVMTCYSEAKKYESIEELVMEEISEDLEIQHIAHFINVAINEKKLNNKEENLNILEKLPYDLIFLTKPLEKYFIGDRIMNPSYKMFLIEDIYEGYFEKDEYVKTTVLENNLHNIKWQLNLIASPKKTRTEKCAFLRSLYIETLCEEIDDESLENFVNDNHELIEIVKCPFKGVEMLKEIDSTFYIEECPNEYIQNEIKKVKKLH